MGFQATTLLDRLGRLKPSEIAALAKDLAASPTAVAWPKLRTLLKKEYDHHKFSDAVEALTLMAADLRTISKLASVDIQDDVKSLGGTPACEIFKKAYAGQSVYEIEKDQFSSVPKVPSWKRHASKYVSKSGKVIVGKIVRELPGAREVVIQVGSSGKLRTFVIGADGRLIGNAVGGQRGQPSTRHPTKRHGVLAQLPRK